MKFADFNADERNQLTRDIAIPQEIEREQEAIYHRVLNPEPRLFPVGVVFLIPEGMA